MLDRVQVLALAGPLKDSQRLVGDGARFPPDVTLGIQAKEFNLGYMANSMRAVICLLLRSGFCLATLP